MSTGSKVSTNELMNDIQETIQSKVESFINGLNTHSTLDIIERLPIVIDLRKTIFEKDQIISVM